MSSVSLDSYIGLMVQILTCDGRHVLGYLEGFDQITNLIISDARERIFSADEPVREVDLGLYIVRGDDVAYVGEVDEELDKRIDYDHVFAPPLKAIWEMK